MKKINKFFALLLVFSMVMTMTLPTFATGNENVEKEATATASYSMFSVNENATVDIDSSQKMTAKLTYTGSSFLNMYLGTPEQANTALQGVLYTAKGEKGKEEKNFIIPVNQLGVLFPAAVMSSSTGDWKDNNLKIEKKAVNSPILVKTLDVGIEATGTMWSSAPDKQVESTGKLKVYSDGSMTVSISYKKSSFTALYKGTYDDAINQSVTKDQACQLTDGAFEVPVNIDELNKDLEVTLWSKTNDTWAEVDPPRTIKVVVTDKTLLYTQDATVTTTYSMFKAESDGTLSVYSDGSMEAEVVYKGSSFLNMYLGTAEQAKEALEGLLYTAKGEKGKAEKIFTIPLSHSGVSFPAAVLSSSTGDWKANNLTVTLASEKSSTSTPSDTTTKPSGNENTIKDGTYSVNVASSAEMFKVVNCVLNVENGKMTATLTLSGTGYDYICLGTAALATKENGVKFIENGEGQYTYKIPVTALDEPIAVAAHSIKNDKWYDRELTFQSDTIAAITDSTVSNQTGTQGNTNQNEETTQNKATVTSGETTNKGEVKDGTYKPSFSFSGGSGRATITCDKVVVKNGKAMATIVFSSSSYTWVKVNGTKYYNENKGGNSTFVIPVNLNGKTNITAETSAMSTTHEIDYVLYCYVDGTKVNTTAVNTNSDDNEEDINSWGSFEGTDGKENNGPIQVTVNQPTMPWVIALCIFTGILDVYVIGASVFFFVRWKKKQKEV